MIGDPDLYKTEEGTCKSADAVSPNHRRLESLRGIGCDYFCQC